jgi:glyoxylase-like metal-dependent hydrolase (beta-lactamase superfamily II)
MIDLHCLSLPTPFPVGPVNVYLALGSPLTLIDTGPKEDAARSALEKGLRARGCRVEDLEQIILTHHHVDHVGLTAELVARSGASVFTHPFNLPWLADHAATRAKHAPFYRELFKAAGVPEKISVEIEAVSAAVAQWTERFAGARLLHEGDRIYFAQRQWQVYHTPGHAGGLICLWEPHSRTLLANDHMLKDISSNAILEPPETLNGPRPRRLLEYVRELERMAKLKPATVLPGHGNTFYEAERLAEERVSFHQQRAQTIHAILEAGPLTLWQITQALFPDLRSGIDYFLGLSETLGHLDLLEEERKARARRLGELLLWERAA